MTMQELPVHDTIHRSNIINLMYFILEYAIKNLF